MITCVYVHIVHAIVHVVQYSPDVTKIYRIIVRSDALGDEDRIWVSRGDSDPRNYFYSKHNATFLSLETAFL